MSVLEQSRDELRRRVAELDWYHTIELAHGILTPGWFDTRAVPDRVRFPSDLTGKRCLDVGTFDGFWAFEMERRGGDEVVAIDLLDPAAHDWPADTTAETIAGLWKRKARGGGFELARGALGSSVRRVERSVYELDPAVDGEFDFVYIGSVLLHLRDPVRALECVRSVCRGEVLAVDAIDLYLTLVHPRRAVAGLDGRGRPWWWKPSMAGLVRMVEAAGLELTDEPRRVYMPAGEDQPAPRLTPRALVRTARGMLASRAQREAVLAAVRGDPHAAIRARPAGA